MKTDFGGRKTSLCYLERDGKYLILHRTKKANDEKRALLEAEALGVDISPRRS